MVDRAIGTLAAILVAALALPTVAAVAQEAVPVLALLVVCLFAVRLWLSGFG